MKALCVSVLLILSACSAAPQASRAPLNLPNPEPLKLKPIQWSVIPRDERGTDPDVVKHTVIFGLSEAGYKSLAENVQDIINFISLQRKVLDSYRKYYEEDQVTKRVNGR